MARCTGLPLAKTPLVEFPEKPEPTGRVEADPLVPGCMPGALQ